MEVRSELGANAEAIAVIRR